MTATAHQMRLSNAGVYAPMPPPPFGLGRVLGLIMILATWALIASTIWLLA
jgi:hypothetical protein